MPPVRLLEQPVYEFHYDLEIQIGHLNYGGRVDHEAIARIAHEVRVHLFHCLGIAENNLGDDRTGTIMGDLAVTSASEVQLFDRLHVESHVGEMGRSAFRMFHRFTKDGALVALVETGFMAFDYAARAMVPITDVFKSALGEYHLRYSGRALDTIFPDDNIIVK